MLKCWKAKMQNCWDAEMLTYWNLYTKILLCKVFKSEKFQPFPNFFWHWFLVYISLFRLPCCSKSQHLERYAQNLLLGQNLAITKKSTVFTLTLWNSVKISPFKDNFATNLDKLLQIHLLSAPVIFYKWVLTLFFWDNLVQYDISFTTVYDMAIIEDFPNFRSCRHYKECQTSLRVGHF